LLAPAPTSLPAGTGWGASSSLWHRRGWHHPQPVPTPGAGDTPGGHSTGGSQTHPQPSPSLCPMAFVTPEVSPRSGSVGEAVCSWDAAQPQSPAPPRCVPPAHPTQLSPPLPPAAATSFPAGTKSSSFHPNRGCAGGEGGTHLQGGLGPPYRSVGGSSSPLLGPCGARFCPVGHLGDTLGSQLSPLVHLEGIWRSHLLPMGHLSGTDESQHSPMGHLGGSVLSYGATGGHWGSWFIPIGHLEVPVLPYGALGNKFPP